MLESVACSVGGGVVGVGVGCVGLEPPPQLLPIIAAKAITAIEFHRAIIGHASVARTTVRVMPTGSNGRPLECGLIRSHQITSSVTESCAVVPAGMVSDTLPPNPWRWVPARVRFGRFEGDFETGELRKDGTRIHLQERPFQLLKALIARPGELVTREELRRATYSHHGKPREALEHFQRFQEIFGETPDAVAFLGFAHARSGDVGRAREALESLERLDRRQGVPATDRAIVYIALNERDSAFQWLERAVAARDWHPGFLGVDPLYDSLRTDARFERLLSRVGLPR